MSSTSTTKNRVSSALFSSASDNWPTPQGFFDVLDAEFHFVLDVCASVSNSKTDAYYALDHSDTARRDGLGASADWAAEAKRLGGAIWMNPPYGRTIRDWMAKAAAAARAGATVVCLVPSRTGTRWFHDHVLDNDADVRFVKGRLKFGDAKNSAPFDSLVVIFRPPMPSAAVEGFQKADDALAVEHSHGRAEAGERPLASAEAVGSSVSRPTPAGAEPEDEEAAAAGTTGTPARSHTTVGRRSAGSRCLPGSTPVAPWPRTRALSAAGEVHLGAVGSNGVRVERLRSRGRSCR